jgi:sec-independent protein translocase protein TatC
MKTKKITSQRKITAPSSNLSHKTKLQFIEHLHELRRRVYYIAASVVVWGCAAYAVQQHLVNVLLRPARGEHFIYTSPGGGIDFLFRICVYSGVVLSLPVIVYNTLRFIEPLLAKASRRFVLLGSFISGLLAVAGVIFGYYLGLPAALHFLLHQFTTVQIQPLVTIQSYLGFVLVYMAGSAMLFQLPLLLLFINRIKPLKPKRLLHYERWVILAAFVLAGLMNPTPNVVSQLLVAGPFILMYQVGILLIAYTNRSRKLTTAERLREQDLAAQASRSELLPRLRPLVVPPTISPLPSTARLRPRQQSYVRRGQQPPIFSIKRNGLTSSP